MTTRGGVVVETIANYYLAEQEGRKTCQEHVGIPHRCRGAGIRKTCQESMRAYPSAAENEETPISRIFIFLSRLLM